MNKNIKQAILFLLLIVGILCMLQYGIDYCYKKRVSNKFTRLLLHKTDPQIMLYGSSVVYHQFNSLIIQSTTGSTCYNMGWPGMFFIQYNGFIKEYLTYTKNCKYLVIGCDFDNLGRTEFIRRPDLFYSYLGNNNVYTSLHDIEPQKIFLARYVPGYKLTLLNKAFYTDLALSAHPADTLLGFEPLNSEWEATRPSALYKTRYEEPIFKQFSIAIDDIIAKGIKVVLVIPPVYKDGYKLIQNADSIKAKYLSLVRKDVYFLDYTKDSLCDRQQYFHNYTHLNGDGAAVFSHTFAQDLKKIMQE